MKLFVICAIVASCSGRIYSPCELAHEIRIMHSGISVDKIPFVVCMAGYRHFNTSHQLVHRNGVVDYGIFGLNDSCVPASSLTNDLLFSDLSCLQHVFDSPDLMDMYRILCSPVLVNQVACHENGKHTTILLVPIHEDILDTTKGEEPMLSRKLQGLNAVNLQLEASKFTQGEKPKPSRILQRLNAVEMQLAAKTGANRQKPMSPARLQRLNNVDAQLNVRKVTSLTTFPVDLISATTEIPDKSTLRSFSMRDWSSNHLGPTVDTKDASSLMGSTSLSTPSEDAKSTTLANQFGSMQSTDSPTVSSQTTTSASETVPSILFYHITILICLIALFANFIIIYVVYHAVKSLHSKNSNHEVCSACYIKSERETFEGSDGPYEHIYDTLCFDSK